MIRKFYNRFIKPTSIDNDQAEREIVLNYLLVGILGLSLTAFVITLIGPFISGVPVRPAWLANIILAILFIAALYFLARYKKHYKTVAIILTLLIASAGCATLSLWSVWDPHGILLLSLAVVMAGILIGARYSIYVTCGLVVVLIYLQQGEEDGFLHPDRSWLMAQPILGDVMGISTILFVVALVSWLFNRQMELSLKRAQHSERALQRQRDLLEIKVEKRARQLEAAQLEKMQQLYRFAELGQLSTALFHDLANHLSTVNLDIEGLSASEHPDIMRRIQQNVGHINTIVRRVRQQIGGKSITETLDVLREIDEVVKILSPTADQAGVAIKVKNDKSVKKSLLYKGDITRFRQVVMNLISNGIEAYPSSQQRADRQVVEVGLKRQQSTLLLSVNDHGRGIRLAEQSKIFDPFYTTKKEGVGIGLFIVKQVAEKDFGGSLSVTSDKQHGTTFIISLPKTYYAKNSR